MEQTKRRWRLVMKRDRGRTSKEASIKVKKTWLTSRTSKSSKAEQITYFCYSGIWSLVVTVSWLRLHAENQRKSGKVLATSCKPQPVTSDLITGVFNLREKCHISCCRDLGHDCDYSEPSPVLWQGNGSFNL